MTEIADSILQRLSPIQLIIALLIIGMLSGGGMHAAIDKIFLNQTNDRLDRIENTLSIVRCELRAARSSSQDWWNCYADSPVFIP